MFSPRTRGCSARFRNRYKKYKVFPAHAGMFPFHYRTADLLKSFPRARGDVPMSAAGNLKSTWFSPRTRGCSVVIMFLGSSSGVFPAHAGMFLSQYISIRKPKSFPRARGDVPVLLDLLKHNILFSPRTRGCSFIWIVGDENEEVFPAHAGMFLGLSEAERHKKCFPRARGDVPICSKLWLKV